MSSSENIFKGEDIRWLFPSEERRDIETYFLFEGAYSLGTNCDLIVIQSEGGTLILSPPKQPEIKKEEKKIKREKEKESKKKREGEKKKVKKKSKRKTSTKRKKKRSK
ncbi:MAG: hypothetical protein ACP5GI_00080 [Sulfolobales archaeon]|mgnify:CR=1 FL=1